MIDINAFALLENKPMPPKADNSRVSEKPETNNPNEFSNYMDKSKTKSVERVEARDNNKKAESNIDRKDAFTDEKNTNSAVNSDDAEEAINAKNTDAEDVDAEAQNTQATVENDSEEEEKQSTAALVSLMLQRAIKSNIEDSEVQNKGLNNAVSVIKGQTSALENLIQKNATDDLLNKDIFLTQKAGDGKNRLSPELIKLMMSGEKDIDNLNKLNGQNSRQEILSDMKLKPVDEVIALSEEGGDLIAKLLEKLDLDKTKGESLFQNRMHLDKALVSSEANDTNLTKMVTEGVDRNVMVNSVNSSERSNAVMPMQQMKMNTPVSSPEWGTEFGKRIQMMMKNNIQHAEIRMDPPEMGRIHIKINISQDQANISFTALHANVREAIETNMNRLRDMLGETGMQLGETDVGTQFQQQTNQRSDEQGQFSFQQQKSGFDGDGEVGDLPPDVIHQSIDGVIDYFA